MKPFAKTPMLGTSKSCISTILVFYTAKKLLIGSVRNWIKKQQSAQEVSHG